MDIKKNHFPITVIIIWWKKEHFKIKEAEMKKEPVLWYMEMNMCKVCTVLSVKEINNACFCSEIMKTLLLNQHLGIIGINRIVDKLL